MAMLGRLKQFDAYPKTLEDFRVKTWGGATITLISVAVIVVLFSLELTYFLTTDVREELFVDTSRGEKLKINFDIDFPKMPCLYLSIDAMDVSGDHQLDILHSVFKKRLSMDGKLIPEQKEEQYHIGAEAKLNGTANTTTTEVATESTENKCGSCYGAETEGLMCCNTCEDVREAYRRKGWAFNNPKGIEQCTKEGWTDKMMEQMNEGCKVYGFLEVSKVAGNMHFAPGKSFQQHSMHVHDLQPFGMKMFNMSHHIHRLSFGEEYPGIVNPLDGYLQVAEEQSDSGGMMYQYFIKVVPTIYKSLSGNALKSNQFSVTKHKKAVRAMPGESGLPGVFFMYDLSPMMVQLTEHKKSLAHFLTGVCAIVGGVFTVAGMVDGMLYHSTRALKKKVELGKAS
ncbi:hypothetical protein EMCRGX_G014389 [Ephydatia muelleri]|eukprot:Em0005g1525a